jgi:excisionase family DNA binding protein
MAELTTSEAAVRLGVTDARVRQLIGKERLPAIKRGRDYFIDEKDLELVKVRTIGRPKKVVEPVANGGKINRKKFSKKAPK